MAYWFLDLAWFAFFPNQKHYKEQYNDDYRGSNCCIEHEILIRWLSLNLCW